MEITPCLAVALVQLPEIGKLRRNIQFYQILELAAMQLKQKEHKQQDLDLKELLLVTRVAPTGCLKHP